MCREGFSSALMRFLSALLVAHHGSLRLVYYRADTAQATACQLRLSEVMAGTADMNKARTSSRCSSCAGVAVQPLLTIGVVSYVIIVEGVCCATALRVSLDCFDLCPLLCVRRWLRACVWLWSRTLRDAMMLLLLGCCFTWSMRIPSLNEILPRPSLANFC